MNTRILRVPEPFPGADSCGSQVSDSGSIRTNYGAENGIAETEQQKEIRERFEDQEKEFQKSEKVIADMRAWLVRNRERIAPFKFFMIDKWVQFYSFSRTDGQQKDIARAFGKDGWKREKDSHTCGAIHWVKDFDGAQLKIHEAEIVKLNPIENVKL